MSGVTVTRSGSQSASATTDSSGNYTFTEAAGGSYTVTPSLSGDTFSPASQTFNNLSANQTQNFTASATTGGTFTISGQVTVSGSGVSGVTMTLSGSQSATATTDSSGNYTFTEPTGGNYTVTPSLSGDTFSPASQTFNKLSGNQTQNFTASQGSVSNLLTVSLSYQLSQLFTGTPPAGARFTVTPQIPGFTIAPFSSQDLALQGWDGTLTASFSVNPYTGMNIAGSMPHLASGGGQWTTTFTLVNNGAAPANVALNFFDHNGKPLPLPLTFPQGAANQTTATFTGVLAAGAALVIETAGLNNPLVTGWAQLLSDGEVSAFAVFTDNVTAQQQQQAVVPVESLNLPAYLLWFDNTQGFSTGVALANESALPANVTLLMRDDTGAAITTQTIPLPAKGHTAFGLAAKFSMTANLRGTIEFDVPSNGQISVLGLSFNPASAFTSIPVTPSSGSGSVHASARTFASHSMAPRDSTANSFQVQLSDQFDSSFTGTPPAGAAFTITPHIPGVSIGPSDSVTVPFNIWAAGSLPFNFTGTAHTGMDFAGSMPHLASGGGQWTTTFTILNTGAATANITLNFFDDHGSPLALPVTFPQGIAGGATDSTFTGPLNAGAGLVIQTAGLNLPLSVGSAQLLSDGPVSGFAVFTDNVTAQQQQQAVVPLQSLVNHASSVLWFDNTNGFSTGVALANVSANTNTITLIIRDDTGAEIKRDTIQLAAQGHMAFGLATNYPMSANLRGTIEFDASEIGVLGLAFNPESAFTSIPTQS